MTAREIGQPQWQVRWARCENDRRQRAYEAALDTWRRREEQLVSLRIEATGFLGCTEPRTGLPVALADDEVVYRVLPRAELVEAEARHLSGLPAPALTLATLPVDPASPALPTGLRVVDTGMAVVTDRRVAFAGRAGRREWAHTEVRGPGHHPDVPITLLPTVDGRRPAGLRVPAAAAVNFRFYLTLAFATATGARGAVAPQVDALLAAHRAARPEAPYPLPPEAAPAPRLRPERLAAAGAVAVALTIGALAAATAHPAAAVPYRTGPEASGAAAGSDDRLVLDGGFPSGPTGNPTGGRTPSPRTTPAPRPPDGAASDADGPVRRVTRAAARPAAPVPAAPRRVRAAGARPSPATTPRPRTTPSPSDPAPSPTPTSAALCLQPLQLPLVGSLLCAGS